MKTNAEWVGRIISLPVDLFCKSADENGKPEFVFDLGEPEPLDSMGRSIVETFQPVYSPI